MDAKLSQQERKAKKKAAFYVSERVSIRQTVFKSAFQPKTEAAYMHGRTHSEPQNPGLLGSQNVMRKSTRGVSGIRPHNRP